MKKRNITLVFLVLLFLLSTGCHNTSKEAEVKHQTADENEKAHMEEYTKEIKEAVSIIGIDDESQCKLIEDEEEKYKDIILEYSQISTDVWYAVDDLNQNGRLELILAINNGTALYTDFTIFEVNEEFSGLQKYQFADSNTYMKDVVTGEDISDSLPDIIIDKVEWTKSLETGRLEYYWTDSLRMNSGEHYIGYYKVWLEDNLVYQTLAAYEYSQSDGENVKTIYYDESGNEISEEQFNALVLLGLKRNEKELNWRKYQDVIDNTQENEIQQQNGIIDIDKYNISDANLKKSIQECVELKEGTVIDSITWVDEGKKCMRVSIRYAQQPEKLWYNHLEDYFFFVKADEIEVLYVDYSNDGSLVREVWENPDFSAHFEDVNFDGQPDLIISLGVNGVTYGEQYCAYLYSEEGYEYCPSFEYLSRYYVDNINKQIVSTIYESTDKGRVEVINYYIFKNNMFQEL